MTTPNFRLGFNSGGSSASVNHLHFQVWYAVQCSIVSMAARVFLLFLFSPLAFAFTHVKKTVQVLKLMIVCVPE